MSILDIFKNNEDDNDNEEQYESDPDVCDYCGRNIGPTVGRGSYHRNSHS